MKKACPYCGSIHDRKYICDKKPQIQKRQKSKEDIFRWSYDWKAMREYIMRRDRYLCVACFNNLPGTVRRLNNEELSVHHIRPLKTNFELRLDEKNLITLCRFHHEKAENGEISAEKLLKIL